MCGLAELAAEIVLDVALDAATSWWQPAEQQKPPKPEMDPPQKTS
ncbi:MAG: hypothetical protein RIC55_04010 [Pirellulaceae bacterium]